MSAPSPETGEVARCPMAPGAWIVVNDTVMGGVSSSEAVEHGDVLRFSGYLSLDHGGGFASTRAPVAAPPPGTRAVTFEARGDRRRYQCRLRRGNAFDGVAWRASFATTPERWEEVTVPIERFEPVFRGRAVADAPPLLPRAIGQVGFLLAERQAGAFRLEVRGLAWLTDGRGRR